MPSGSLDSAWPPSPHAPSREACRHLFAIKKKIVRKNYFPENDPNSFLRRSPGVSMSMTHSQYHLVMFFPLGLNFCSPVFSPSPHAPHSALLAERSWGLRLPDSSGNSGHLSAPGFRPVTHAPVLFSPHWHSLWERGCIQGQAIFQSMNPNSLETDQPQPPAPARLNCFP